MKSCVAIAHPNIALVKYWGKRDPDLNLPAVGSISVTLDALRTQTSVTFVPGLAADRVCTPAGHALPSREAQRVSRFVDRVRRLAGIDSRAEVVTENDFPTGAGLASSASGFAALALAATHAAGLRLPAPALSALARCGSGSAARSIFGGFVQMRCGTARDGHDACAEPLAAADHWPLQVVVAITSEGQKRVGSTEGMERTRDTSPFYDGWVATSAADLAAARQAIRQRDFEQLATVSEHSCMKMHGLMLSARPPLLYWNAITVALVHATEELRRSGVPVFYTIDAGPQLKAVCLAEAGATVREALEQVPGVERLVTSALGQGARLAPQAPPRRPEAIRCHGVG